jgi:flotillin
VRAEIERQRARALQEKRRLDADIVQPAIADQRAAEESARGDAAAIIERGRAEAESLRKLVDAYLSTGGTGAREVLALQNLLPLLGEVAGSAHGLSIKKLTVLPPDGAGTELARTAIGASEQIKAATGVDLTSVARRLGG